MAWFGRQSEEPATETISQVDYFAGDEAWQPVPSSFLHSVAFYGQGATGTLGVRFRDRATGGVRACCLYDSVSVDTYQALLSAPSHGVYFHSSGLYDRQYRPGPM